MTPDVLATGDYFAEFSGTSGGAPIHIAVDGTATGWRRPSLSTWAMLVAGFVLMGWAARRRLTTPGETRHVVSCVWVDSLT